MRPLHLKMSAFGAYAECQELDFTELGSHKLFLIHGPTGAGKTTILDAICFALYGRTSGEDRKGNQMRSQHAAAQTATFVEFDFALGERRFRVERSLDREAVNKKGKNVIEPGTASLWELPAAASASAAMGAASVDGDNGAGSSSSSSSSSGKLIASKSTRVTEEVERLLGFECDQFRQVVLLPQGQFRRLLTASSIEREKILEALFKTEIYKHIEEQLKTRVKGVEEHLRSFKDVRLQKFAELSVNSMEEIEGRCLDAESALKVFEQAVQDAQQKWKISTSNLLEGKNRLQIFLDFAQAEVEIKTVKEEIAAIEDKKQQLERGRKCLAVMELEKFIQQSEQDYEAVQSVLKDLWHRLDVCKQKQAEAGEQAGKIDADEKRLRLAQQKLARLEEQVEKVAKYQAVRQDKNKEEHNLKTQEALGKKARETLEKQNQEIEKIQQELIALKTVQAMLPAVEAEAGAIRRTYERAVELDNLNKELVVLSNIILTESAQEEALKSQKAAALTALEEKEALWLRSQAVVLAGHLSEDQPCPVCGSSVHPSPAAGSVEELDTQSLQKMRQALQNSDKALIEQTQKVLSRQSDLKILQDKQNGLMDELRGSETTDPPLLKSKVESAEARLVENRRQLQQLPNQEDKLARLKMSQVELSSAAEQAVNDQARCRATLEALEKRAAELESELEEESRSVESHAERVAKGKQYVLNLENAIKTARENLELGNKNLAQAEAAFLQQEKVVADAKERLAQSTLSFNARLQEEKFADLKDYQKSKLTPQQLQLLEDEIKAFQARSESARARFAQLEKLVAGASRPDMDKLEKEAQLAENLLQEAEERRKTCALELAVYASALKELNKLVLQAEQLEQEYAVIGRLAEVASGQNPLRMTFQRYVLSSLLDEVLLSASTRLHIMSKGRYLLCRAAGPQAANRSGGLDLEVMDNYTGLERPAATLSGGESFLASLSLALGLADVVQSYAGGVQLDTIFIDEGFGSLDPEALDLAMRALIDLQERGRLVGIISHVPELRERIEARLEVRIGRQGSTACFVLP